MSATIKLDMDDLTVEIREDGITIAVLRPDPNDTRRIPDEDWQTLVLTMDQTRMAVKFITDNVEIK